MYFLWVYLIITFTFRKCHKDTLSVKRLWVPFPQRNPQPFYTKPNLYTPCIFYQPFIYYFYALFTIFHFIPSINYLFSASPANIRFNYVDYETVLQHIQAAGFPI